MKIITRFILITAILSLSNVAMAQLRGINYQAVVIDENGKEVAGINLNGQAENNKTIGIRFSIFTTRVRKHLGNSGRFPPLRRTS